MESGAGGGPQCMQTGDEGFLAHSRYSLSVAQMSRVGAACCMLSQTVLMPRCVAVSLTARKVPRGHVTSKGRREAD